jgi:signal transduction histidine kinase
LHDDGKRVDEVLRAQRDLALRLADASTLAEALDVCLEVAVRVAHMDSGGIYLVNEDLGLDLASHRGLPEEIVRQGSHYPSGTRQADDAMRGRPIYTRLPDLPPPLAALGLKHGFDGFALLPTAHEGRVVATLVIASRNLANVPAFARDSLEAIAAQIGAAIVRIRAQEAVRRERQGLRRLLDVYEKHRQLVAYEIHDGVAQPLAAAMMSFEGMLGQLRELVPAGAFASCELALELMRAAMAEARQLMSGLRPTILDDFGVVAAIAHLVGESRARTGTAIEWSHAVQFSRLALPLETALFRIVQEALTNALRHSQSHEVRIRLSQDAEWISVEVEDDGIGFRPEEIGSERFGLQGIRQRASLFGGRATIHTGPGKGTRVVVVLPVVEGPADS